MFILSAMLSLAGGLCELDSAPTTGMRLQSDFDSASREGTAYAVDASRVVQLKFDDWRGDAPSGVSVVLKGGEVVNNVFPALSADRSRIALLYFAGHPLSDGYPTLDLYSTKTLELERRIEFLADRERISEDGQREYSVLDPEVLAVVKGRVAEINQLLRDGEFRSMPQFFQLEVYKPLRDFERFGMRVEFPDSISSSNGQALTIRDADTGKGVFAMTMPSGLVEFGGDPDNQCGYGGSPDQAWFDPELRLLVLRIVISSSRHGCEQPERWVLHHL